MKKILAALTLSALIFTACTETETPVTVNLSKTTATEVTT
jgi:PBP1b-binding outer membrane lipoprotein LpoB